MKNTHLMTALARCHFIFLEGIPVEYGWSATAILQGFKIHLFSLTGSLEFKSNRLNYLDLLKL